MLYYDHWLIVFASANYAAALYYNKHEDRKVRLSASACLLTAVILTFIIVRRMALGYAAMP